MAGIGTAIILERDPGLVGCGAFAMAPGRAGAA
jgi:hypothetical protein